MMAMQMVKLGMTVTTDSKIEYILCRQNRDSSDGGTTKIVRVLARIWYELVKKKVSDHCASYSLNVKYCIVSSLVIFFENRGRHQAYPKLRTVLQLLDLFIFWELHCSHFLRTKSKNFLQVQFLRSSAWRVCASSTCVCVLCIFLFLWVHSPSIETFSLRRSCSRVLGVIPSYVLVRNVMRDEDNVR